MVRTEAGEWFAVKMSSAHQRSPQVPVSKRLTAALEVPIDWDEYTTCVPCYREQISAHRSPY